SNRRVSRHRCAWVRDTDRVTSATASPPRRGIKVISNYHAFIGTSSPWRVAHARASSYPASPRRKTPLAGALAPARVRGGGGAGGVPSATMTWPACWLYPIPTPPPWWKLTQLAPLATLTMAFRNAQSLIASLPSFIDSVSRLGLATLPVSRWSRPITIGA